MGFKYSYFKGITWNCEVEKEIAKEANDYFREEITDSSGKQKTIDVSAIADKVF